MITSSEIAGRMVAAEAFFPLPTSPSMGKDVPLLVLVHGGSYDKTYFNPDPEHTVRIVVQAIGIPAIAVNRPGYGETSNLGDIPPDSSSIQEQGKWLHSVVLPRLWKQLSEPTGAKSIALYGHSIGGAVCCVAAAYASESSTYPLSSLIVSGIGVAAGSGSPLWENISATTVRMKETHKDKVMLGRKGLCDAAIYEQTTRLNQDMPLDEGVDITTQWLSYWTKYAEKIKVAVLYLAGSEDALWDMSPEKVVEFGEAFTQSVRVETVRIPCAPHNIEMSHQRTAFWARLGAFAVESVVEESLREKPGLGRAFERPRRADSRPPEASAGCSEMVVQLVQEHEMWLALGRIRTDISSAPRPHSHKPSAVVAVDERKVRDKRG